MKENEKYYTPSIEEFHIGFEYENRPTKHDNWVKYVGDRGPLYRTYEAFEHDYDNICDLYRVKYLDHEDIESFGFKFLGRTIDNWYKLEGNFEVPISNHRNMQIRLQHDFRTHQGVRIVGYEYDENSDSETLYRGSCKNKSELKKILIQIGVI